ncbi:hypothetical protein COU61_01110 [Candidatus Pacearchaeota archaeon CG10_big_fil_rev_8_21_14_0_10_35_13]|nr:MAG: hypothetical protein COU61_01110 [Candidatus Pacearchaeota archaeon CG10_big_fil_rev_8_21_14_0_10_35_13]
MKKEMIDSLVKKGALRAREKDLYRIKAMIERLTNNSEFITKLPVRAESSDIIFREIYESIRQLGDAKWWLLGYEPRTHDVSLDILKELEIKNKVKLNNLDRIKKIRHDLNYRGIGTIVEQAKEILELWNDCGKEILSNLLKEIE